MLGLTPHVFLPFYIRGTKNRGSEMQNDSEYIASMPVYQNQSFEDWKIPIKSNIVFSRAAPPHITSKVIKLFSM